MRYIKIDLDLLEKIGDFRQCGILSFLLNQSNEIEKVKTQKWQQTTLAKMFKCSPRTIYNDLSKLEKEGWISYEQTTYKNLTTTQITLTDKSLRWFNDHALKQVKNTQPSQSKNREIEENKGDQKTRAQVYREYIKKQMEYSNKIIN